MKWYRKAAEQGNAKAQYNLGASYAYGEGVPQNDAKAVEWYRKAAERGHANAQNNLGTSYARGEGVPQNYVFAHMWFTLAAASGLYGAQIYCENAAKRMTPDQIAEAQRMAREWLEKHQQ